MVAVRRESAGDISQRQIGWNGSERIESSAFWSSNPSTPHCCPSLYLFPSPRSPFPDYSAFYLAHRCLSDRTPDTIFPLSSLSIPRTIIPRFISHRERKQVLLPFIGHTDGARSFQRDTIYHYTSFDSYIRYIIPMLVHHSRKVNKFLKTRSFFFSIKLVDHQPRSHPWIGIRGEARLSFVEKWNESNVFVPTYRWIARSAQCPTLPSEKCLSLSLSLSLPFSLFLSLSLQTMEMRRRSITQGWSVLSSRGCKLVRSFPRGRRSSLLHARRRWWIGTRTRAEIAVEILGRGYPRRRSYVTIPAHAVRISRGHLSWVAARSRGGFGEKERPGVT